MRDNTVILGDCVEVMATMEPDSVDAIVCDPPYGLEFMGKAWDSIGGDAGRSKTGLGPRPTEWTAFGGDPFGGANPTCATCGGRLRGAKTCACEEPEWRVAGKPVVAQHGAASNVMQDWHREWAEAAFRVAKPGAYLLAFGGTRTSHRLAAAIEDAGWEIRDTLCWVYACLSEDTEVLTEHGWRPGLTVRKGDRIAAWDPATGSIRLDAVQETFGGPYRGDLVRLAHADTDQLLTPNHRVWHQPAKRQMVEGVRTEWYEDAWEVGEASVVRTQRKMRLPVAGLHDGPGIGGEDYAALLGWVWTEGGFDRTGLGVRLHQSSSANPAKVAVIDDLLVALDADAKRYERERPYANRGGVTVASREVTWFWTGALAQRVREDLPGKHPTYDLLWRMTLDEKRAFLAAAMAGDGHGNQFYQKDRDDLEWMQALGTLTGHRVKVGMRTTRAGGAAYLSPQTTTEFQPKHRRDLEPYDGDVWCVRVPTGAFVARRKGLVFITGNSGFPKSRNIGKDIDKMAGAEREVVGTIEGPGYADANVAHGAQTRSTTTFDVLSDQPATEDAAKWDGWGTALKPAWEPIVMARKPFRGPVAANVLKHGTGALNIDGSRIPIDPDDPVHTAVWTVQPSTIRPGEVGFLTSNEPGQRIPTKPKRDRPGGGAKGSSGFVEGYQPGDGFVESEVGRWPANVVLTDPVFDGGLEGVEGGGRSEYGPARVTALDEGRADESQYRLKPTAGTVREFGDTGTYSRFFLVPKASRADREPVWALKGNKGPRENTHTTVKPLALMEHLVRLVTPPGGLVLDPFAGSGTTALAADGLGFRWVAIEKEEDHVRIIRARLYGHQRGLGL